MKRLHSLVLSAAVLATLAGTAAADPSPAKKVQICHGTASATNPWVLIDVSVNSDPVRLDDTAGQSRNADFAYNPAYPDCLTEYLAEHSL